MAEQDTFTSPDEKVSWQYTSSTNMDAPFQMPPVSSNSPPMPPTNSGNVSWTATEYIEHNHSFGWFLILALATATLAVAVYFLTREYFAAGTILVVGMIVGVFASRKPQLITYELTEAGLRVGQKIYHYDLFKSFALIREGSVPSITLIPLKRFMLPISAHFSPADEQQIVATLSEYLPFEEHNLDSIDRLSRRLRL